MIAWLVIYLIIAAGVFSIGWDVNAGGSTFVRGARAAGIALAWPAFLAVVVVFGLGDLAVWAARSLSRGRA